MGLTVTPFHFSDPQRSVGKAFLKPGMRPHQCYCMLYWQAIFTPRFAMTPRTSAP